MGDTFKNLLYKEIPGKALGMPDDALGPTKKVFVHGDSYSTHLNARDDEKIFPLLVPNQVGVDALLVGAKPTAEQYERAQESAARDPSSVVRLPPGMHGNSPEAEAFEQHWHDAAEKKRSAMLEVVRRIMRGGQR